MEKEKCSIGLHGGSMQEEREMQYRSMQGGMQDRGEDKHDILIFWFCI